MHRALILCGLLTVPSLSAVGSEVHGRVVHIADGDTLTVLDAARHQHKIRLDSIDAPESRQPFGKRSRQSLAELCADKDARIVDHGKDRYGRIVGSVFCAGIDANGEQVRRGMAWVYVDYAPKSSPLFSLEAAARQEKRGLWVQPNAIPPWVWRKNR